MTEPKQPKVEKKEYIKPEVTEVRLVPAEAVLGKCMNGNGANDTCIPDLSCLSNAAS